MGGDGYDMQLHNCEGEKLLCRQQGASTPCSVGQRQRANSQLKQFHNQDRFPRRIHERRELTSMRQKRQTKKNIASRNE